MKVPYSPFTTHLSGSAKETELRIRNIFQWKKKRPPVIALIAAVLVVVFCGSLIGFSNTPRNGTLGEVYQAYFAENPTNRISYDNKDAMGYPSLVPGNEKFDVALEYVRSMELRSVLGGKKYIGDFNYRDGAISLRGTNGQTLKIDMYPTVGYVVISKGTDGMVPSGEEVQVYRWDESFDMEVFLGYLASEFPENEEEADETLAAEVEQAIADGCVVHVDGDIFAGQKIWDAFVETISEGKPVSVQLASYYGEGVDGGPVLFRNELTYTGNSYILSFVEDGERIVRHYSYLMRYEGNAETPHAIYDSYVRYILTHDNTVTWEELMNSTFSSQMGVAMDFSTVYTDYRYEDEAVSPVTESVQSIGLDPMESYERNKRLATIDGIGHMPLDELPQEVLDGLTLVSETDFTGMYNAEWGWRRVYTAPGVEITTTAPSAAYLKYREEVDKDNRELFPTGEDFYAYIEGEEGREWLVNMTITDDKFATLDGLKVGMTCEQALALGYWLKEGENQIGNVETELEIIVENNTVVQMRTWWTMGRYIGKFFEL